MEHWKDISGYPGYQVSDNGNVRSFWRKKKSFGKHGGTHRELSSEPYMMPQSDDGNGYLKVLLYNHDTGKRKCAKVHRLVAEAFIPDRNGDTVDHIRSGPEGKRNNSIQNLRWVSRSENIKKAYRDGVCDDRIESQNKPVISTDLYTGDERYFDSIKEASIELGVDRSSISHVLNGDIMKTSHYIFEYAGREEKLLYGSIDY